MNIPGIGEVAWDDKLEAYVTEALPIAGLRGHVCRVVLEGYREDPNPDDFHAAIRHFVASNRDLLKEAEPHVYSYYADSVAAFDDEDDEDDEDNDDEDNDDEDNDDEDNDDDEDDRKDLWKQVSLGRHAIVSRRPHGDQGVYISLECNCDWEREHGLQIVFKNGQSVSKVGPFDGHLTNSDAFDDQDLEGVVYVER